MAASDKQRKFNSFFPSGNTGSRAGRPRRSRSSCENYDKGTECCRLDGTPCTSPGRCPDYAPVDGNQPQPRPGITKMRKDPAPVEAPIPAPAEHAAHGAKAEEAGGAVLSVSPLWDPEKAVPPGGFQPGQAVIHKYFGKGVVKSVEGYVVETEFEDVGTKRLFLDFVRRNPVMVPLR